MIYYFFSYHFLFVVIYQKKIIMEQCCERLVAINIVLCLVFLYMVCSRDSMRVKSVVDGKKYDIVDYFKNPQKAAEILAYINENNQVFIEYLKAKYVDESIPNPNMPDEWKNHYAKLTHRLMKKYRPNALTENDPPDKYNTSWTEDKGKLLTMCIREKDTGDHNFHDLNTLMFVSIHELAHIASKNYGHKDEFWFNFRALLQEATALGLYDVVDYRSNPINYCSLPIQHSPLFDDTIPNNPSDL